MLNIRELEGLKTVELFKLDVSKITIFAKSKYRVRSTYKSYLNSKQVKG